MEFTGGCQCGSVRYKVQLSQKKAYLCHCRKCQKALGNVFAAYVNVSKTDLIWTNEKPSFYKSSEFAQRGFCIGCGSPICFEPLNSPNMDLTVGSFDDPSQFVLVGHNGVESRLPHFSWEDTLPKFKSDE